MERIPGRVDMRSNVLFMKIKYGLGNGKADQRSEQVLILF
jgi:hypothetical protein